MSLIEANVNTWIGMIGSWILTALCIYYKDALGGTFWATNAAVALCTVWSLLRGYYIRRFFARLGS